MGDITSSSSSDEAMFPSDKAMITPESTKAQHIIGAEPSSPLSTQKSQPLNVMVSPEDAEFRRTENGSNADDRFIPGAGWKTKKASDEYQRSWAMLEDKQFSLSRSASVDRISGSTKARFFAEEFGDPFDDRPVSRQQGRS